MRKAGGKGVRLPRGPVLGAAAIVLALSYLLVVVAGKTPRELAEHPLASRGLELLGIDEPGWQTFVVLAERDVAAPADALWRAFEAPEAWAEWSGGLVQQAAWGEPAGWRVGAALSLVLDFGPPIGVVRGDATLAVVEPGRMAAWVREAGGVRSVQLWSFTPLPDGRARIAAAEVFSGLPTALMRPLAEDGVQVRLESALTGLTARARGG